MNRLRAYRDIEGLNQQELGDILGMSPQMVSAIEAGRRSFTGDLTLLGYSADRLDLPDMSEPLHRHKASTSATTKKRAHELLRLAGEVFWELRDRTPGVPSTMIERRAEPMPDELEDLAADTRCALRHEEHGPIGNLTSAVERAGVCLVPMVGLPGIDGISTWVDDVPVIGLSPTVPGDRFRLSLGHEVGHLSFHTKKSGTSESEANRFASYVLVPPDDFRAAMPERGPQLRDFINLKKSWGVSVAALVYRAHEDGYIDDSRYRALQIQMSKWRRQEPGTFDPMRGTLLGKMVEVNGGPAEVAARLGVNQHHVAELLNWSHLRVA